MDKPLTVARAEFIESLVNLINDAKMPAFIIRGCFEEVLPSIRELENNQYMADLKQYKEGQEE